MARPWRWLQVAWAALRSRSNQEFYDRISAIYDEVFVDHRVHAENIARALTNRYEGKEASTRVLDLGCGTGLLFGMLSERGFRVVGLDLSRESLCVLKRRDARAAVVQADAESLPFADASFESVVCLGTWRHFANFRGVLDEIARALGPDGSLVIGYFPPALGGAIHVRPGRFGSLLVRLYGLATRKLGYADRADFALESETFAAALERFGTAERIASGPDSRLITACRPKRARDNRGTEAASRVIEAARTSGSDRERARRDRGAESDGMRARERRQRQRSANPPL